MNKKNYTNLSPDTRKKYIFVLKGALSHTTCLIFVTSVPESRLNTPPAHTGARGSQCVSTKNNTTMAIMSIQIHYSFEISDKGGTTCGLVSPLLYHRTGLLQCGYVHLVLDDCVDGFFSCLYYYFVNSSKVWTSWEIETPFDLVVNCSSLRTTCPFITSFFLEILLFRN